MKQDRRAARALEIEDAAYAVLEEAGYDGLTMLAVAKRARASNETLYRWYGDKLGLFEALIRRNTETVREVLEAEPEASMHETLHRVGPALLTMLLGPRAIALNRAAAADASGKLGQTLAQSGRETVAPWIAGIMARAIETREIAAASAGEAAECYLSLLIGDAQIRRATGAMAEPSATWVADRAKLALARVTKLFAPSDLDAAGPTP